MRGAGAPGVSPECNPEDDRQDDGDEEERSETDQLPLPAGGGGGDDIIRHIIRDIVAHSSQQLKTQREKARQADKDIVVDVDININNGIVIGSGSPTSKADTQAPQAQGVGRKEEESLAEDTTADANIAPSLTRKADGVAYGQFFVSGIKSQTSPHAVSDTLAAFLVRAVVLDPRNDFRIERELTKEEVERLITLCVEKIVSSNNVIMETIKMQVYFDTTFPAQADYLHKEKMTRLAACAPILREISEVKTKNISIYDGLYRKIVSYVLKKSHVGNPLEMRVVREATAALESVFPQSELSSFISLSRAEKEAQLNGLTQLVTGIRLFNKQLGKGGDTVEDLIDLCVHEMSALMKELEIQTKKTEERIQQYMAVIDYAGNAVELEMSTSAINRIKSAIVFHRQYLMYLDALTDQTRRTRENLVELSQTYDDTIQDLKATCKSKTAVPVDQVYPLFIALANMWSTWMDELFLLAFRRGILDSIEYHSKAFDITVPPKVLTDSAEFKKDIEPEIIQESQVIAKASELMAAVSIINKKVEVVHPGNSTRYFDLPVEYGGFCPYTLIRRDGLVVPGDKNIGMIRYRDKLFAFASQEAAKEFSKFPDRQMETVLELAKRSADLVQLLHLYNYFPTVDALENAKSFTKQKLMGQIPMVSEAGCQVDTHIIDTKIDKKYKWNEWDLRRQALMFVNLKKMQTHSSQTDISHFRRESETQHYEPKSNTTQTYTESSTNVAKKVNFIAGLRSDGKPKNRFRVIDLTLDI